MAAPKKSIELLPQEEWEQGTTGKILKWTLTVGRHIVIFTELIVILAFLSRFKFDRELTDLNEEVKQKKAIIESSAQFEKSFRFLQKKIDTAESLRKNQVQSDKILTELSSLIPVDVALSDFNVSGKQISFSATALSEAGLATFIKNLRESPKFEKLILSQVNLGLGNEVGIKFQLKTDLIPEKIQ